MTKRWRDSLTLAFAVVTGIATLFTIIGFSMKDLFPLECVNSAFLAVIIRALISLLAYGLIAWGIWAIKGIIYKECITLKVGKNSITVKPGNIFAQDAWRVIGVDSHFDTKVDDVTISETSLHGQLVKNHGKAEDIIAAVEKEAIKRKIQPERDGKYTFSLGTVIPYKGTDGEYIMVALTNLDKDQQARTRMTEYESTLMTMWRELNKVYTNKELALPILGSGITRFDDDQDDPSNLLRCMLCTLNSSKVHFKSKISIIVYDGGGTAEEKKVKKLPLYEYRDLIRIGR